MARLVSRRLLIFSVNAPIGPTVLQSYASITLSLSLLPQASLLSLVTRLELFVSQVVLSLLR